MRRLEALPGQACELRPLMAEHLCRYAAVAWLAQPAPAARWRKLDLLQRLVLLQPEARSWAVPAIRDRLLEGVQELQQDEAIADPLHLAALLQACAANFGVSLLPQAGDSLLDPATGGVRPRYCLLALAAVGVKTYDTVRMFDAAAAAVGNQRLLLSSARHASLCTGRL
jgi:hypothetical protein